MKRSLTTSNGYMYARRPSAGHKESVTYETQTGAPTGAYKISTACAQVN